MAYHLTNSRIPSPAIHEKPNQVRTSPNPIDQQWTEKIVAETLSQGSNL